MIYTTEAAISSHLTAKQLPPDGMPTPAKDRAAIRRLREALKPFVNGSVDIRLADLIPEDLDAKLAAYDQQLARQRPTRRPLLEYLCRKIGSEVTEITYANGATMEQQDIIKYIDFALTCARIDHPDFAKHRKRLAALVFPKQ